MSDTEYMKNRWVVLQVINVGTLMSTMDAGIVNVALPTIAHQFGISLAQVQWVVTCYLLTMVALLPLFGKVSDMVSRRMIYSLGFFVFSLGSLSVALSWGFWSLIVSRCIQGIGATMIMANSQAMVVLLFPNHERGKALGLNAVIISIGTLLGPALGGPLLSIIGWAALFLIQVPLGLAGMFFGLRWFPKSHQKSAQRVDAVGSLGLALGACLLLWAASNGQTNSNPLETFIPALTGCLSLVGLAIYEARIPNGILDRELFTNRRIVVGNLSLALMYLAQTASSIALTFYMQDVLGYSPAKTGFLLCAQPLIMGIVSPFAGWYRDRHGPFLPVTAGPILCGLSTLCIALPNSLSSPIMILQLSLFGLGFGLFQATNNADVMSASPPGKTSLAGSMLALIRYFGMSIGMGVTALILGNIGAVRVASTTEIWGLRALFVILTVVCFVTGALAWLRAPKYSVARSTSS